MIAALLQLDTASGETWLSFSSPPPADVRASLKETGWLYNGGLRSWRHKAQPAPLPTGVTCAEGHDCNYSQLHSQRGDDILHLLTRAKASVAGAMATAVQP